MNRTSIRVLLPLLLALAGCASSTKLVDHWRDPGFRSAPLRNVYVVALRRDAVRRRIWEDGYVAGLRERGVQATASYVGYPDAAPDTLQMFDVLRSGSYDGVIVSTRLPNEQETRAVPPATTREAETRRNPYTGFYYTVHRDVYMPGYTEVDEVRRFQTDIWATADGRLVWSGSVSSYDPVSEDIVESIVEKRVLPEASKDGIFP